MPKLRHHFAALLKKVNPPERRIMLASSLPGDVRDWLQKHEFTTEPPHTRLSGSYGRKTAIADIKDVDVLLLLPSDQIKRTANAVLQEVKRVLDDYPDATALTAPQRRSVHLEFPTHDLHLDIVPAVAEDGLKRPLLVPDRPAAKWIESDPLGYSRRLTQANDESGKKLIPLIKLFKAWRDVQMKVSRPKSYVLEVMTLYAVENGEIVLHGNSTPRNFADLLAHVERKYGALMDFGVGAPRIADPQTGAIITTGWDRSQFETFMRRTRESLRAAERALGASDDATASNEWARVFGAFWPTPVEVKETARAEAATVLPGRTTITSSGGVVGYGSDAVIPTRPTTFHGDPVSDEA